MKKTFCLLKPYAFLILLFIATGCASPQFPNVPNLQYSGPERALDDVAILDMGGSVLLSINGKRPVGPPAKAHNRLSPIQRTHHLLPGKHIIFFTYKGSVRVKYNDPKKERITPVRATLTASPLGVAFTAVAKKTYTFESKLRPLSAEKRAAAVGLKAKEALQNSHKGDAKNYDIYLVETNSGLRFKATTDIRSLIPKAAQPKK